MRRDEVIETLRKYREAIQALGAASLYLYGSHARDEAGPESDIDVFVDRDPNKPFGFMQYTGLIHLLEDTFGVDVDVATRSGLHPDLREEIESSAIRVF